MIIIKAIF